MNQIESRSRAETLQIILIIKQKRNKEIFRNEKSEIEKEITSRHSL